MAQIKSGHTKKLKQVSQPKAPKVSRRNIPLQVWLYAFLLLTITLLAYQPSWNGKQLWDDDAHITGPALRTVGGLVRIWIEPGATQQYYPLVHSVFWTEYRLWGSNVLGYHLSTLLLHILAALMLILVLRKLAIPGALLAGAIFALHPVQVESVAWITELKNTLSACFFLSAAYTYLFFDAQRKKKHYVAALTLFILGLMSKSVIATLPVALLIVFWWKRGRIQWKQDVVPLIPFFVIGIVSGLFTAWMERTYIGATGSDYGFTLIERCLIAGRALWFYLEKLIWPANLIFIYPRWEISQSLWWQYLYPVAALVLAGGLWLLRKKTRAPMAAFLYFTITLFPALGFINVYPFRYSFVADHFQYLATIGPIALASAACAWIVTRQKLRWHTAAVLYLVLTLPLALLTYRQSRIYSDSATLYQTTITRNPSCWMAYNNLGTIVDDNGNSVDAIVLFRKALSINPKSTEALNSIGNAFLKAGQPDSTILYCSQAVALRPDHLEAIVNIGNAYMKKNMLDDAILYYQKAIHIQPTYLQAINNLGNVLLEKGLAHDASVEYRKALAINPEVDITCYNLANALLQTGETSEVFELFKKAAALSPKNPAFLLSYAGALAQTGQVSESIAYYKKSLELNPANLDAYNGLARALLQTGHLEEGLAATRKAFALAEASGQHSLAVQIQENINELMQYTKQK